MTRTVSITLELAGARVTDATVTLSDQAAAYGIRAAGGAVVAAAGTAVPHVGAGVYKYLFADADPGVEYEAVVRVAWPDGSVDHVDRELDAAAPGGGGFYATREQLELKKGEGTIRKASRAGNESTEADADRIAGALADADVRIDEFFAANGFVTPVTAEPLRTSLSSVAIDLAYAYLLDPAVFSRGPDEGGPGRDLYFSVRAAMRRMQRLALFNGGDAERLTDAPTYPTPVE